jgi:hypothetical protein
MNRVLLQEIIKHVMAGFGVLEANHINYDKTKSLCDKQYLTSNRIEFQDVQNIKTGQVWACQFAADHQELKVLLGNCSQDSDIKEFAMLVQLKGAPCYGLFLVDGQNVESEPLIAVSLDGKEWLECNTFLQASFLTGMEQVKDTGLSWDKCVSHQEEFEKLKSFIEYHQLVYGDTNEGQED